MSPKIMVSALSAALALSAPASAVQPSAGAGAEAEVRNFILTYNDYYAANDLDRYFASFDPALTQWWPSGRVNLQTYDKMWRELVAKGGGTSKAVVSDLQVQVDPSGDAAVATYILEVTPRKNAEAAVERNQETDVLFKRDGQWKIVHVNYGPASPAKP